MRKILMGLFFILCALGMYGQQQITGTISEEVDGQKQALPFANVFIPGTTRGVTSDFDGKYQITVYDNDTLIKVSYMGYTDVLKSFHLDQGDLVVDVTMSSSEAALQLNAVTVTAKKNMANENMLLMEQKKAMIIKESIGAKQLSNLGISDAAAATTKISGVTKNEGSGDIYIRGLGDRYLSTTMNGLPIPSDDVEKKNIDLNLFNMDVIDNVSISKTYAVGAYADQTSGNVDVKSKTFTDRVQLGLSTGSNTNVLSNGVFGDFRATQNTNDMVMGFHSSDYSTTDAVSKQDWNATSRKAPVNYGFSLMGGKELEVFDRSLSVFATLTHSGESQYQSGTFQKYRSNIQNAAFDDVEEFETKINTTALLNIAFEVNQKTTLNFNSLAVFKTVDELYEAGRSGDGYFFEQTSSADGDSSIFVRDQNIKTTQMFINQLLGKHKLSDKNTLTWGMAYNIVRADEPNRIRNMVTMPDNSDPEFIWVGGFDQRKSSQEIRDNEASVFVNDELLIRDKDDNKIRLNFGANTRFKTRSFESQFVGVVARDVTSSSIDDMGRVFTNSLLYDHGDLIVREALPDSYDASLFIGAAYMDANFEFKQFTATLGARYEYDNLFVKWDVGNYPGRKDDVVYDYSNVLPSLNMKYQLSEKNALRFATSKTITLPEFKELAVFEYVTPTGRVIKGNKDLKSSTNYNMDLKWEMFMRPKELISLTGFYKLINDPINLAQKRSSSGAFYFANTGEQATVYGLEFEARVNIISATSENSPSLRANFNLTKMWFYQDLFADFHYYNKTESGLQGAAELITNAALIFSDNKEKEFQATLSANYSSDKIFALGVPESQTYSDVDFNSEIIEKGFLTLDCVISKKLSERVSLKLTAKNLLNPSIEQTQMVLPLGGVQRTEVVQSYRKGAAVSLGLKFNLN